MKTVLPLLLFISLTTKAFAQFSLLKDVNPGNGGNNGLFLKKMRPGTWIVGWDGGPAIRQELWKTDGTTAGTSLVRDLYPGPGWGVGYSSDPDGEIMNNELFFTGSENGSDFGLYKTDGTASGTTLVFAPIIPNAIANIDNTLFFGGGTIQYGTELYKSDGTASGTVLIKDIWPGTSNGVSATYLSKSFIKANGYVFFRANDGVHGNELWRTDGTTAGTQMVKDIFAGAGDGLPNTYQYVSTLEYMVEWNGNLFFVAQEAAGKEELWRTDGTASGTVKVSQFNPVDFRPFASQLLVMGDHLYFLYKFSNGNIKLISSDGTTAGTREVNTQSFSYTSEYIAKGMSLLYFSVNSPQTGTELWRSDGTAAGTFMIKDLNPGAADGQYPITYASCLVNWNDIYFTGNNGQTGMEIFFSNGSPGNTSLAFEAVPGNTGSNPLCYSNVANRLAIKLTTSTYGEEEWLSNNPVLFMNLLSFTGVRDSSSARLEWKTSNEENTSRFEIEKSTDSNNYNRIGTLQAVGGNVMEAAYSYTDRDLLPGTYYYRLKVFNLDGSFRYSNAVTIQIPEQQPPQQQQEILVRLNSANPASGSMVVLVGKTASDDNELQIIDMLGRVLQRKKIVSSTSGQTVTIDLNNIAAGRYFLSLVKNGKRVKSIGFVSR